ncbi:hypothetical protein K466DRAFT_467901, partial [Polyporus arcularius HHB13444]
QVRAITCDNASPNDVVIDVLAERLPDFRGKLDRGRCFDHIVNLCAKSVLKPFDVDKKKADDVRDTAEE